MPHVAGAPSFANKVPDTDLSLLSAYGNHLVAGAGLSVLDGGVMQYEEAWALQRQLVARRATGELPDTLFLLEHPHTYTLGSKGKWEHLLVPVTELEAAGISVIKVDRGGDITYHGPGQLVAYPILKLRDYGFGIVHYLRVLETVLIELCAGYGIGATRVRGLTGVWVDNEKVAAIGARVDVHGISLHGCALNVAPDLDYFANIVPCGIQDKGVTSLSRLLGYTPVMDEVKERFVRAFIAVCGFPATDGARHRHVAGS
ncbi:MAG: lipoyl(octanoyl) transferase LipB [Herpetosiphon sp.]